MKLLTDNTIKLRPLEAEDIDLLYEWENNTEIWPVSNTLVPFSRYILKQYLETAHQSIFETGQLKLIIELIDEKRAIGATDLFDFDIFHKRAGIGILINNKNDRKQGYATAALNLMIDYCFTYLKLNQLYCNIDSCNKASLKLFENAGFVVSGIKKKWLNRPEGWLDEHFMQLIK